MDEGELPESVKGDCDTRTKHNVREDSHANSLTFKYVTLCLYIMLNSSTLWSELTFRVNYMDASHHATWVKHRFSSTRIGETVFSKCSDGGIRKGHVNLIDGA
jgi:hypothetical protein